MTWYIHGFEGTPGALVNWGAAAITDSDRPTEVINAVSGSTCAMADLADYAERGCFHPFDVHEIPRGYAVTRGMAGAWGMYIDQRAWIHAQVVKVSNVFPQLVFFDTHTGRCLVFPGMENLKRFSDAVCRAVTGDGYAFARRAAKEMLVLTHNNVYACAMSVLEEPSRAALLRLRVAEEDRAHFDWLVGA